MLDDKPIIFLVDDEPELFEEIANGLRERFGAMYEVIYVESGEEGMAMMPKLRDQNRSIALFIADYQMPGMSGAQFLHDSRRFYYEAREILFTQFDSPDVAITEINEAGIDRYLTYPWQPAEDKLFPVVEELLDDWRAEVLHPFIKVKGVMNNRGVRIREDSTLQHAAEIVAHSGAEELMVVGDNSEFVGIVSVVDILRGALPDVDEIVKEGVSLRAAYQAFLSKGAEMSERSIEPFIIRTPLTVGPEDHVAQVVTVMLDNRIGRLPVVTEGRLLGTISQAEICSALVGAML